MRQPHRRIRTIGRRVLVAGASVLLAAGAPALAHPAIDEQIATLNAAIAEAPSDATLFLRRGELHRVHREWEEALADFRRARALDPALAAAELASGRLLREAGRPREARAALDAFLARRPGHVEGLVARARALADLQENLAAERDYSEAIARTRPPATPRPSIYLERAAVLAAAGERHIEAALRGLDDGIARLGPIVTLQMAAIDLDLRLARHDAALARVDTLAAQSACAETWLARRGAILADAGRAAEAAEAYRGALDAIEALPVLRRGTRAVGALEREVRTALARLTPRSRGAGGEP